MSHVVSLRLRDEQMERMRRIARRMNRTVSEASALLLEEALRMAEFAFIQFRDSTVGRQAYIQGSSLAVWEVVSLVRAYGGDVAATAKHLSWPDAKVRAALTYAATYPDEIEHAIQDNNAVGYDEIARMLPNAQLYTLETAARQDHSAPATDATDTHDEAPAR